MNHIELVGPPGAGKSSLRRILADDSTLVDDRDLPAISAMASPLPTSIPGTHYWGKAYWKIILRQRSLSKFSDEFPKAMEIVHTAGEADHRSHFPGMYFSAAQKYIVFRDYSSVEDVIHDEGLSQLAAEVLFLDTDLGEQYLQVIPCPDIVINVDCPGSICLQRQINREKPLASGLRGRTRSKMVEKLESYREYYRLICSRLEKRGALVVSIDTENTQPYQAAEHLKLKL